MSDKEINEAIAEACGVNPCIQEYWVHSDSRQALCMSGTQKECIEWFMSLPQDSPYRQSDWQVVPHYKVPDYCHDLNAMHEAENCLVGLGNGEDPLYDTYIFLLGGLIYGKLPDHLKQKCHDLEVFKDWLSVNADAKDKATAFLMALDKWKEP